MAKRKSPRSRTKALVQEANKAQFKGRVAGKSTKNKWVYEFGDGRAEGSASMRNLLGGKGAGLAEMANLRLPVPPGFTITTDGCTSYYSTDHQHHKTLNPQLGEDL